MRALSRIFVAAMAMLCLLTISGDAWAYFGWIAPGGALPSGATCASTIESSPPAEIRPDNATANASVPTSGELTAFLASPTNFVGAPPSSDFSTVAGDLATLLGHAPTTDQVLQWAACKWGIDENTMRAEAWEESTWSAYTTGDLQIAFAACAAGAWDGWTYPGGFCYQSYGILQLKFESYNTSPMAWDSTAFNADFRGAFWRACMNGDATYLDGPPVVGGAGYPNYTSTPSGTASQMEQGCLGAWFSGQWYSQSGINYANAVNALISTTPWLTTTVTPASLAITSPASGAIVSGNVPVTITMPGQGSDPDACYACLSIDGVHQTCIPSSGPWIWPTRSQLSSENGGYFYSALDGHHVIQADSYTCAGAGPYYHAGVAVTLHNALPNTPPYNNYGASILGNTDTTNTATAAPHNIPFVTLRFVARDLWTGASTYNFTPLNNALANAAANGRSAVLDIELGVNVPDSELSPAVSGQTISTRWGFNYVAQQNSTLLVPGQTIQVPIPWNTNYQSHLQAFINAIAADVSCTGSASATCAGTNYTPIIVGADDDVDGYNDDEMALPAGTGSGTGTCTGGGAGAYLALPSSAQCTASCGSSTCTFTPSNDVTTWIGQGYTRLLVAQAMATVDGYWHTAFPNIQIHHMILRNRFPTINDSGVNWGGQTCSGSGGSANDCLVTDMEIMQYACSRLPSGYCEVQVNNAGYQNAAPNTRGASPNMADAALVAAASGAMVGYQSNGNGVNLGEPVFAQVANQLAGYDAYFMEWYQSEAAASYSTLPWSITEMSNQH